MRKGAKLKKLNLPASLEEMASRSLACEVPERREWEAKPNGLSMTGSRAMTSLLENPPLQVTLDHQ